MIKKIALFGIVGVLFAATADAAQPAQRRGAPTAAPVAGTAQPTTAQPAAARAAVSARSATPGAPVQQAAQPQQPVVAARAASAAVPQPQQRVVQTGTTVAAATTSASVIDPICRERWFGCMDSFCMMENESGGRCMCSNRHTELNAVLAEIERLDEATFKMATEGVERIEMGARADEVFRQQQLAATNAIGNQTPATSTRRTPLDLGIWDMSNVFDAVDFGVMDNVVNTLEGKSGDQLHIAVRQMCEQQMSGCEGQMQMLRTLYSTTIQSDCRAFENELQNRRRQSQQKLAAAERALREAALESYESANRYDAGQCAVQFRQCMQTTGGCGADFTGCVGIAASENAVGGRARTTPIRGAMTTINIASSSFDTLTAKRPLCDNVTQHCVAAVSQDRDAVWKIFLGDIAPTIKSAELMAESNARMDCIGNISACFQRGCRDNMDPNNPDGSFDLCLTRPETMLNICRVPLEACGIPTTSAARAQQHPIWDFVVARLAAMRVDSCTTQVRECLQSNDRCGKDYTGCIGLDTATIMGMCPADKLVGCQYKFGQTNIGTGEVMDEIARMVQGIFLAIDNSHLRNCQKAVDAAMIKVCGSVDTCDAFDEDNTIGTESLLSVKNAAGDFEISGLMSMGSIGISMPESAAAQFTPITIDISAFAPSLTGGAVAGRINASAQSIQQQINNKIAILSSDTVVRQCVEGRSVQGLGSRTTVGNQRNEEIPRFPHLLDSSMAIIANAAVAAADRNYTRKFNELTATAFENQSDEFNMGMCAAMASRTDEGIPELFKSDAGGRLSEDGTIFTIPGTSFAGLISAMQNATTGTDEGVVLDAHGTMVASVQTTALYANGVCSITTRSTVCKGMEQMWAKVKRRKQKGFRGTICPEYNPPITEVQEIRMR
ncbi:MAG: hypothetical protein FWF34_00240 [Alphaproteobacteria bacterium]|nr:hypothetical protein [Alphaproteobacteria bacterium]MCL2889676.1 hypothetical protein [Alphaproteobacteria bacterium]